MFVTSNNANAREHARGWRGRLTGLLAATALLMAAPAQARITRIEITSRTLAFGGYSFAGVGQFERIVGIAYGEVDPSDPRNAVIADLQLSPTVNGKVQYQFSFYILKPLDLSHGNHKMMYEPPNRGNKTYATLNRSPATNDPATITDPVALADSFLWPRGYTTVWSGWENGLGPLTGLTATAQLPAAQNSDGSAITGPAYEYIVTSGTAAFPLTYPAATLDKANAVLTHRVHLDDTPVPVPSSAWTYNGAGTSINLLPAGWVANDIYEFSYTAKSPTVNGLGFAAVRDFNAFLRHATVDDVGTVNPLAGDVTRIYTEVFSQSGRMLNDFTRLGFNEDESGAQVFDGMLQWIAAGDGLNMNYRWSQTKRTERNRQEHLYAEGVFPFANTPTYDPITGRTDSRYARCEVTHTCPLGVEMYSSNEYWVKAGSLLHTDPTGTVDLPDSPYTRNYLIASHQHGVGNPMTKGVCQQLQNPLNSAPIQRALFIDLDEWATNGTLPPASRVPRLADGTLAPPLPQSAMGFPTIPGVTYTGLKTTRYLREYGSSSYYEGGPFGGVPIVNPPIVSLPYEDNPGNGPIYPSFVPTTDSDGNDIAGVRLPDVTVPLATYTGWALRAGSQANDGCEAAGQYIPFATTQADRMASGDPRLSVEERYPSFGEYHSAVMRAIDDLVKDRLMLCEDADDAQARLLQAGLDAGVPAPHGNLPPHATVPHCLTEK